MKDLIIQGIGFLGLFAGAISVQLNSHKSIVLCKTIMEVLFIIQYIFLNAYVGMIMGVIGIARNLVFTKLVEKKKSTKLFTLIMCVFTVFIGIITFYFTWDNSVLAMQRWTNNHNTMIFLAIIVSIFSIIAKILSTIGYGIENPKIIRAFNFPSSFLWLIYNVVYFSLSGILTEIMVMSSIIIATIRYRKVNTDVTNTPNSKKESI